jgi:UDP-N-acetylmuramate: L-alanyl-gamma-D-glutamyl-meso-diaminopimelate ligase
MASLAGLFKGAGFDVSGSDETLYSPMKEIVEGLGLPVTRGYLEGSLPPDASLAIVGNVVTARFPILKTLAERRIPFLSLPQALRLFFLQGKKSLVCAGCHGKSTVTNLASLLFAEGGLDPGFLVGGSSLDFPSPFRQGKGEWFIVEGDEYDSAFFDKVPKFVHYNPHAAIINNIEFDHADIYPDLEAVLEAYRSLVRLIPPQGLLLANGDDPLCREVAKLARSKVEFFGEGGKNDWRLADYRSASLKSEFRVEGPQGQSLALRWPKIGRHNALNAVAAVAAFLNAGGDRTLPPLLFPQIKGARRRQELLFDDGSVALVDDFAHHPTAVGSVLAAVKESEPARRLVVAFEPRSNTSRRAIFQKEYAESLARADLVFLPPVDRPDKAPAGDRLDVARLARDIGEGKAFYFPEGASRIAEAIWAEIRAGDIVVVMSNGDFGGIARTLRERLESQALSDRRHPRPGEGDGPAAGEAPATSGDAPPDGRLKGPELAPAGTRAPHAAPWPDGEEGTGFYFAPIQYSFKDQSLLLGALTHRSSACECQSARQEEADNQRLEFLGDAVLDLFISEFLFQLRPRLSEGAMSRVRACFVCESRLAEIARSLKLGESLILSQPETMSGGRDKTSLLADALEALLGAVFLDGGAARTRELVLRLWKPYLSCAKEGKPDISDYKTELQEYTQRRGLGLPLYSLQDTRGPAHEPTFSMSVQVDGYPPQTAMAHSKKEAAQLAAKALLDALTREEESSPSAKPRA